ncbi:MAG: squalene synthase HpnC [Acidimicrobiales bacterium]
MTAAAMRAPSPSARAKSDLPPEYLVLGRAGSENFPVASRLLPPPLRADLMALYGWARLVDQIGDDYAGDRMAALDEVERQFRLALGPGPVPDGPSAGDEIHPLVARMAETVRRLDLPTGPLFDLVQANRQDQIVSRYESFEDLVGYCRLSANPVGRMVLAIFGVATPERNAWSDSTCTALQLVEHWQDVAEDAIVGRVYLPLEDMRRFGVSVEELVPPPTGYVDRRRRGAVGGASAASRALLAFEAARARRMLDDGSPLVANLTGRLRVAVAGFTAGGHAALDGLAAVDFDVYAEPSRPRMPRFAAHLVRLVRSSYWPPAGTDGAASAAPSGPAPVGRAPEVKP